MSETPLLKAALLAGDVLNAVRIGLQSGAIRSAQLELMYSDGPAMLSLAEMVERAITELGRAVADMQLGGEHE